MGVLMAATGGNSAELREIKDLLVGMQNCMGDDIGKLSNMQATLIEQVSTVSKTVEKMSQTIYGNGHPGLTTSVNELDVRLSHMEKPKVWLNTLISTLITLGITAIFYLILSHGIIK
jgi:hypothetical protein